MMTETEDQDDEFGVPGRLAIFTHECCTLKFEKDIEDYIYHMDKTPSPDPYKFDIEDLKAYGKPFALKLRDAFTKDMVITLEFSYMNVLYLFATKDDMEKEGDAIWLILSFFDDDETIRRRGAGAEALLEKKVDLIDRMIDFPFIKKLETPASGIITAEYLHRLFNERVAEDPDLPEGELMFGTSSAGD